MKLKKENIKKYMALPAVLIIIALLVIFRSVPSGKLWNNYSVLYVPASANTGVVSNILKNAGIKEYVSLEEQHIPIMLSENSVEMAMLKMGLYSSHIDKNNSDKSITDYLNFRNNYFYDSTGKYKLIYIPEEYKKNIDACIHFLEHENIEAGSDSSYSYPWLLPIIVSVLMIMLAFFSKNKLFFVFECLIPVLYVFCNPFYSSAAAVILLYIALFFISNLLGRKGVIKYLSKGLIVAFIIALSILSAFAGSILSGVFFILTLIATALIIYLFFVIKEAHAKRYSFNPVFIRPAKMIQVFGGNGKIVMPIATASIVLVILYFTFSNVTNSGLTKKSKAIFIPGKAEVQAQELPQLEDFYRWNWDVVTLPYKSLNLNYYDDETVVFPDYIVTDGIITEKDDYLTYDEGFKTSILKNIDDLDFESIEKVIKVQGSDFTCGYVSAGSYHVSLFSIIMMFVCFAMLLFIYFSTMIKHKVIKRKGGK